MVKTCAYCSQEIPSQANVCPLCNRAQPVPRATPKRSGLDYFNAGRLAVFVAISTVALMVWAQKSQPPTVETRPKPVSQTALQVSGTRHLHAIEVTNRESEPLSGCVVRIPEQWNARIEKLAPLETTAVVWTQFRNVGGTEMPVHIGQNPRDATVTCDSHRATRKGAALSFR